MRGFSLGFNRRKIQKENWTVQINVCFPSMGTGLWGNKNIDKHSWWKEGRSEFGHVWWFKCVIDVERTGKSARQCRREEGKGEEGTSGKHQAVVRACCVATLVSGLLTCRSWAAWGEEANACHTQRWEYWLVAGRVSWINTRRVCVLLLWLLFCRCFYLWRYASGLLGNMVTLVQGRTSRHSSIKQNYFGQPRCESRALLIFGAVYLKSKKN